MIRCINRAAIVVRPRRPYLDRATSLGAEAPAHPRGLAERVSVHLVAEDPKGEEETAPLEDCFQIGTLIFQPVHTTLGL